MNATFNTMVRHGLIFDESGEPDPHQLQLYADYKQVSTSILLEDIIKHKDISAVEPIYKAPNVVDKCKDFLKQIELPNDYTMANIRSYFYFHDSQISAVYLDLVRANQCMENINIRNIEKFIRDNKDNPNVSQEQCEKCELQVKMMCGFYHLLSRAKVALKSLQKIDRIIEVINVMSNKNEKIPQYGMCETDIFKYIWAYIHKQNNCTELLENLSKNLDNAYSGGKDNTIACEHGRVHAVWSSIIDLNNDYEVWLDMCKITKNVVKEELNKSSIKDALDFNYLRDIPTVKQMRSKITSVVSQQIKDKYADPQYHKYIEYCPMF